MLRYWRATASPRDRSLWRLHMPDTSSDTSSLDSGDGRANLLGEVTARDGVRYDIQLKGSGRPRSPAAAMVERRLVRSCANTS